MRYSGLFVLVGAAVALGACSSDKATGTPPLAGVRYINAVPDTFAVDIRMVDQVHWSATANRLVFRGALQHQPTEAKARRIRVFTQPGNTNASPQNVSQVLADTTLTFEANARYTLLLTGSARARTVKFVVFKDDAPVPGTGQVAFRALNANGSSATDTYLANASGDALPAAPSFANVAPNAASAYSSRAAGTVHAWAYGAGLRTTALAAATGPTNTAPAAGSGLRPPAGVNIGGSVFSIVYFPASVAGSPAQSFTAPGIVYLVDRNPGETQGAQ